MNAAQFGLLRAELLYLVRFYQTVYGEIDARLIHAAFAEELASYHDTQPFYCDAKVIKAFEELG